jgi:hypothetical protein
MKLSCDVQIHKIGLAVTTIQARHAGAVVQHMHVAASSRAENPDNFQINHLSWKWHTQWKILHTYYYG